MHQLDSIVVCPETLGPVELRDDSVWSTKARRDYPISNDLVFLGYPARDEAMISATMTEEHLWQGTAAAVDRDLDFLRESAPKAAAFINLASDYVTTERGQPRALELGAGSGWVSWLLAVAGYDTWMVDFEANSLAIGLQYEHANLPEGHRFVGDARYAPFADDSFDLVLLKEFVHHVADYETLFAEVNRVLRPHGILALMEPTRSVLQSLIELRHPDPHEGHVITWVDSYRRSLRRQGFSLQHESAVYASRPNRHAALGRLKQRASRSVADFGTPDLLSAIHLRVIGDASSVIIARKESQAPRSVRPPMSVIDPATLVITPSERAEFRRMLPILEEAARGLRPVTTTAIAE